MVKRGDMLKGDDVCDSLSINLIGVVPDDDLVAVYAIDETELEIEVYPNGWDKFISEVERIFDLATEEGSSVFYVSEDEYYEHLNKLGYEVIKLRRESVSFLTADGLKPGEYRFLSIKEVKVLYNLINK